MLNQKKQIFLVTFSYYEDQYMRNLNKSSCISKEIAEFLFNWSIETLRQFGINILNTIPTKMYLTKVSELENLKQLGSAEKVLKIFDVFEQKKVDKLELLCLFPFIVENNFENAFYCKMINLILVALSFLVLRIQI